MNRNSLVVLLLVRHQHLLVSEIRNPEPMLCVVLQRIQPVLARELLHCTSILRHDGGKALGRLRQQDRRHSQRAAATKLFPYFKDLRKGTGGGAASGHQRRWSQRTPG